jgi:hypothetical protein
MRTNLKVILAATSAAALLASPAMAKTVRHHHAAPSTTTTADAHASAVPYVPYGAANEGGTYTPSKPAPSSGKNNDFQDGPR